jgi:UDP-N-acetylmuramyl pentapeptide phosphotransferase/UDP-N-acetylglucosamine-1-phosphate transferase
MGDFFFSLIIFLFSFVLTMAVRMWAIHKSVFDIPNERSSHTVPTPRGGGIAIVIVWYLGLLYSLLTKTIENKLFFALLSGFPLAIIGFLDDIIGLKAGIRFMIQLICAAIALYFLGGLQNLHVFSINLSNPLILSLPALIAIVWYTNLFNFLDGIDGYIGSEVTFIGFAVFLLTGDKLGLLLSFTSLGFLIWNWQKAKIFMGDVGSTLLGFTIAVLSISHNNNNISSIPIWLILSSVFWFDATVTIIRRIKNKETLSKAHKNHAYQRIVQAGFSHQKTVIWSIVLNLIGFGFAFLAMQFRIYDWIFLICDMGILMLVIIFIDRKKPFSYVVNV